MTTTIVPMFFFYLFIYFFLKKEEEEREPLFHSHHSDNDLLCLYVNNTGKISIQQKKERVSICDTQQKIKKNVKINRQAQNNDDSCRIVT